MTSGTVSTRKLEEARWIGETVWSKITVFGCGMPVEPYKIVMEMIQNKKEV